MCDEVSFWGRERVDFLGYNEKSKLFYCFEIKSCLADFNSKCRHTFFGNLNYYVMPMELCEKVIEKIPKHIGILISNERRFIICKKHALNQGLKDENFDRLFRNLFVAACFRRMTAIRDGKK